MLDSDGYPDNVSLERIRNWDILTQPIEDLLELIYDNTQWADRQIVRRGKRVIRYVYHTGGWSGNEDVLRALRGNALFWMLFWQKHTAGGHYYFRIVIPAKDGVIFQCHSCGLIERLNETATGRYEVVSKRWGNRPIGDERWNLETDIYTDKRYKRLK